MFLYELAYFHIIYLITELHCPISFYFMLSAAWWKQGDGKTQLFEMRVYNLEISEKVMFPLITFSHAHVFKTLKIFILESTL